MALITVRLTRATHALLRRAAAAQLCDQKDVLEAAVIAFDKRTTELMGGTKKETVFPPHETDPDSLILNPQKRYRRSFDSPPVKFTTTISKDTVSLLKKMAGGKAGIGDVVERSIRFHLWDQERGKRNEFFEFLLPAIYVKDFQCLLEA